MRILSRDVTRRPQDVRPTVPARRHSPWLSMARSGVILATSLCSLTLVVAPAAHAEVPQPPSSAGQTTAFVVNSDQLGSVLSSNAPPSVTAAPTTAVPKKASRARAKVPTTRPLNVAATVTTAVPTPSTPAPDVSRSASATAGAIPDSVWAALRQCESKGNYAINTGNGYYGAYQFAASTWRKLGFSGLPHEASPATQDEAARKLQAQQGWGPWPSCTRSLGLR